MTAALKQQGNNPQSAQSESRLGRIAHQLGTITQNVHHKKDLEPHALDEAAWQTYFQKGDVIEQIAKALAAKYNKSDKSKQPAQPTLTDRATIAKFLFEHYALVFGKTTQVRDLVREEHPLHKQWQVHQRIKATYKAMFDNASMKGLKGIHKRVPKDKKEMWGRIHQRANNQSVAHLVRLGKVIHYQAAEECKTVRAAWHTLQTTLDASPYWLSDGQAEIKRSEALVRVFKLAVSHAGRSLSDLTQWEGGDIFDNEDKASKGAVAQEFGERMKTIFGNDKESVFPSVWATDDALSEEARQLLEQTIQAWAQLRHASFHFKGRDGFLNELKRSLSSEPHTLAYPALDQLSKKLWDEDIITRKERIKKTLEAAHCETHLAQHQLESVYKTICGENVTRYGSTLDLPRLNRVLNRARNADLKVDTTNAQVSLPMPAKNEVLEKSPSARCQYVLLKMLYEQGFSSWMQEKNLYEVDKWIVRAIERSNIAAHAINGSNKNNKQPIESIQARATRLWQSIGQKTGHDFSNDLLDGKSPIAYFFHQLAAATATEFRVQRFYESNGEAAQEQAAFIDDLKCDVVAIAFAKYLGSKFSWLLQGLDGTQTCSINDLQKATTTASVEIWQQRLYYLIHFVPVGVVSRLLHQLRKWHILTAKGKDRAPTPDNLYAQCAQVLVLYLDMHDAKFDGGTAHQLDDDLLKKLKSCFESEADFATLFPQGAEADSRIPLRSLREMLRFGALDTLAPLFEKHPITHAEYERWQALQGQIDDAQNLRAELHSQWVEHKRNFDQVLQYQAALKICEAHRHLAHRVRLIDHVQLHNLMMAVLARLVDYAGLWERDLYFVTLALCHHHQIDLNSLFAHTDKHGNCFFDNGQIVKALRKAESDECFTKVHTTLSALFGETYLGGELNGLRNRFSHFNMLQKKESASINLTNEVNEARALMVYDRKLKNSVAKSILELIEREGFKLSWKTNNEHLLERASIQTKRITHLGNKAEEAHHSSNYCTMVAHLFGTT